MAIVGSVGSGKSSLLSAMLGSMERVKGHVNVDVRILKTIEVVSASTTLWILRVHLVHDTVAITKVCRELETDISLPY